MSDNGILAKVPGQYVGAAVSTLPPAVAGLGQHSVEIDAGNMGRVRVYYETRMVRHGKHRHVFWHAVRAEAAAQEVR